LIDERWNAGGQIPDRFIELLSRKVVNYYGVRDGKDWQTPFIAHHGPKAMLANAWSGSGGDCFPFLFRENKLGPVIGTRTWGGLIGMTGAPPLLDGGSVTVPTFAIYDRSGKWIIEGHGVDPDFEVLDDPAQLARGNDPQLERGVNELMQALKARQMFIRRSRLIQSDRQIEEFRSQVAWTTCSSSQIHYLHDKRSAFHLTQLERISRDCRVSRTEE
jgi:tricorn protease